MKSLLSCITLVVFVTLLSDVKSQMILVPDINGYIQYVNLSLFINGIDDSFDAERDVVFLLYTRRNPTNGQRLYRNTKSFANSNFKSSSPTRFMIHGWLNDFTFPANTEIRDAYLENGDLNYIFIDWSEGSKTALYPQARYRIPKVAQVAANLINFMIQNGYTTHNKVVIVGHSFGAQTAGLTAKKIVGGKVKALIGLDPAGPLFSNSRPLERIASTDAAYVEVIHTNGGAIGYMDPIGQADFYPNYGRLQPGCSVDPLFCPHLRVINLFAESLNNNRFQAHKCSSYETVRVGVCMSIGDGFLMGGEPPNSNLDGIFYLETNAVSPFAKGKSPENEGGRNSEGDRNSGGDRNYGGGYGYRSRERGGSDYYQRQNRRDRNRRY